MMKKFKFLEIAESIVSLKIEINKLNDQLKSAKNKMAGYISDYEVIPVAHGEVFSRSSAGAKSFSRNDTLAYIEKKYGKDVARDVDLNCTIIKKSRRSICVRLKKNNNSKK